VGKRGGTYSAVVGVVAATLVLTGCGSKKSGTTPNASSPPASASSVSSAAGASASAPAPASASVSGDPAAIKLYREAMTGLAKQKSVHLSGTVTDSGSTVGLDMTFVAAKGSTGTITIGGGTTKIISVNKHVYMNFDAKSFQAMAGTDVPAAAVAAIAGKWLDFGATDTSNPLGDFSSFGDLQSFAAQFTPSGSITLADKKTVNGKSAQGIKDDGGGNAADASILYVETGNDHLPLQVASAAAASSGSSASSGAMNFDYNAGSVTIAAPTGDVVPISQLMQLFGGSASASPSASQ
jgi:hypothetical protein